MTDPVHDSRNSQARNVEGTSRPSIRQPAPREPSPLPASRTARPRHRAHSREPLRCERSDVRRPEVTSVFDHARMKRRAPDLESDSVARPEILARASRVGLPLAHVTFQGRSMGNSRKIEDVLVHDPIQHGSQCITRRSPIHDVLQTQIETTTSKLQSGSIAEVLVRDRVSPATEHLELGLSRGRPTVATTHLVPQPQADSSEVAPEISGGRIASVEQAIRRHLLGEQAARPGVRDVPAQTIDGLRVQVSAEALEVGGQEHCVGMVDLERCDPTTAGIPAHHRVRARKLVQAGVRLTVPLAVCVRSQVRARPGDPLLAIRVSS